MGILSGAYKYMKGKPGSLIPSETPSGQLSMLPHNYGGVKIPRQPTAGETHKALLRLIAEEARAPFKASRFSGKGDPRAQVTGRARSEELKQKAALAKKRKKRPVPGSITPAPKRTPIAGPKPKDISDVDDLFGVSDSPLGFK